MFSWASRRRPRQTVDVSVVLEQLVGGTNDHYKACIRERLPETDRNANPMFSFSGKRDYVIRNCPVKWAGQADQSLFPHGTVDEGLPTQLAKGECLKRHRNIAVWIGTRCHFKSIQRTFQIACSHSSKINKRHDLLFITWSSNRQAKNKLDKSGQTFLNFLCALPRPCSPVLPPSVAKKGL